MARVGAFSGPTEVYGQPLSFVQPPDNDVTKGIYHDLLLSADLKLTEQQKRDLQDQIQELYSLLRLQQGLQA